MLMLTSLELLCPEEAVQLAGCLFLFAPTLQLPLELLRLFGFLLQLLEKLPLQCLSPLDCSKRILIAFDG